MNALIPRITIEQLVDYRNRALDLYEVAYHKIAEADAAINAAQEMAQRCHPGINRFNHSSAEEIKAFFSVVRLPDRERFLRTARKLIDVNAWAWIIERTDLERLMDKEAKEKLDDQMRYVPDRMNRDGELIDQDEINRGLPPITVENIYATLEQFEADADMIFKRGIANAFSKLDRRFRSHDGWKLGSRIILTYAFDESGHWNWGRRSVQDTLIDIERTFHVLDGKPKTANYASSIAVIDQERVRGRYGARQSEHETEYFKVRIFKNGNAHLWFTRNDLVTKVNKLLGEYYGEVLADSHTEREEDIFENRKTTLAKNFGFFPTPEAAAERVIEYARIGYQEGVQLRVLEPSAGSGNLARLAAAEREVRDWNYETKSFSYQRGRPIVDCIEIQQHLVAALSLEGIYNKVIHADFLKVNPDPNNLYDRVVMNPPLDRERDIDHVTHAMKFLKPGGRLTAIMSAGTEFRETKKAIAFRALMEELKADWYDLPPNSFSEVGTNVNTLIVTLQKR